MNVYITIVEIVGNRHLGNKVCPANRPGNDLILIQNDMIREKIIETMKVRGVKAVDLAKHLGITRSTISLYLHGKAKLGYDNIEKMLDYLNIDLVMSEEKKRIGEDSKYKGTYLQNKEEVKRVIIVTEEQIIYSDKESFIIFTAFQKEEVYKEVSMPLKKFLKGLESGEIVKIG